MTAAFYLILATATAMNATAYASRDACEAARRAVASAVQAPGVCVSTGVMAALGDQAELDAGRRMR